MTTAFLAKNATLLPLLVAVGLGLGGGIGFGVHYLRNNQDVVIRRKTNPQPWNNVMPNQNTKLLTMNRDFWTGRANLSDPRLAFLESKPEHERTLHEQAIVDRAEEIRKLNREHTHHN